MILSSIATGMFWLFYFYALGVGQVSRVVPIDKLSLVLLIIFASIFLREKISIQVMLGALLMTLGAIMIAW